MENIELKDITLRSEEWQPSDLSKKTERIDKDEDDDKSALNEMFTDSSAGKALKELVGEIKKETDIPKRNVAVTKLLKDFFADSGDTNKVRRLVDNGETSLRITVWGKDFVIQTTDALLPDLVEWYMKMIEININKDIEDENEKIAIQHDKEKLVIEKTKKELETLKEDVATTSPNVTPPASTDTAPPAQPSEWVTRETVWRSVTDLANWWTVDQVKQNVWSLVSGYIAAATWIVETAWSVAKNFYSDQVAALETNKTVQLVVSALKNVQTKVTTALWFWAWNSNQNWSPDVTPDTTPDPEADATPIP